MNLSPHVQSVCRVGENMHAYIPRAVRMSLDRHSNGRLKIALGEHDIDENLTKYEDYMKHFNLTEPYYSFDYQNVHFLAMATAKNQVIPYNSTSKQYEFVKQDLMAAHKNKNINWITYTRSDHFIPQIQHILV
jgi:hypothetical protein